MAGSSPGPGYNTRGNRLAKDQSSIYLIRPDGREGGSLRPLVPTSERKPPEIEEFESVTNPYTNMLPGISNINAARTIGRGIEVGKRGNRWVMFISIALIAVLVLPAILAVLSQISR